MIFTAILSEINEIKMWWEYRIENKWTWIIAYINKFTKYDYDDYFKE